VWKLIDSDGGAWTDGNEQMKVVNDNKVNTYGGINFKATKIKGGDVFSRLRRGEPCQLCVNLDPSKTKSRGGISTGSGWAAHFIALVGSYNQSGIEKAIVCDPWRDAPRLMSSSEIVGEYFSGGTVDTRANWSTGVNSYLYRRKTKEDYMLAITRLT
jgi:hypothetical protein